MCGKKLNSSGKRCDPTVISASGTGEENGNPVLLILSLEQQQVFPNISVGWELL